MRTDGDLGLTASRLPRTESGGPAHPESIFQRRGQPVGDTNLGPMGMLKQSSFVVLTCCVLSQL